MPAKSLETSIVQRDEDCRAGRLPLASGVYQILCTANSKLYVGSSVSIWDRWLHHRRLLRRGDHTNLFLQRAWNRHGEERFEWSVLELVDPAELLAAEQRWIDKTLCFDRKRGFNIFAIAGSPGDNLTQLWEGFIDPEGNEIVISGLQRFCRQNALDYRSMHRLASGKSKLKSYKGWTHRNSRRQRDHVKTYHTKFP